MRALRPLSSRSTRHYVTPSHCGACPSPRWQGKKQCRCCSTLRSTTMTSANGVAMSRASTRAGTRQGVWPLPHVRAWPLLSVHAAVGAAHPAYWRPLHAAEHLSSPETGHARCCRGPRSVDRVPGAVAACEEVDKNTPQSEAIKSREATRFIHLDLPVRRRWMARHAP